MVFLRVLIVPFTNDFRFNTFSYKYIALLLCFSVAFSAGADVLLTGSMKVGDNDTKRIHPRYLLSAKDSKTNDKLEDPQASNPINFHLSKDINLTQIRLDNAKSINASLYFVIWNSRDQVMVNTRSTSYLYSSSQSLNTRLRAGDYKLVIVGQCFNPGGKPKGWSNSCGKNWDYEDFSFSDIQLVSPQTSDSITFLQRRHIGDSNERQNDGYGGRWYPDNHEGDEVEYEFTPPRRTKLKSITLYNYRDLIPNRDYVKLTLSGDNFRTQTTYMNTDSSSGNFVWRLNKTLLAGEEYELEIEVEDDGDADDISWDDIILKMGTDTSANINHYRLTYSDRALTCEPAIVTVQACSNDYQPGNACVKTTNSTAATLMAKAKNSHDVIRQFTGRFVGSTDVDLGYLNADDLTLSLTGINKTYYCNGGPNSGSNCDINFADTGFFFSYDNDDGGTDISNQVAGKHFSKPVKLEAFYNDKGQCKNIFKNNEIIPVNLGIQCQEPNSCSALDFLANTTTLGKNNASQSIAYEPVDLKFNRNGSQIDNALYQDAGKINLIASYTIDDNLNNLNGLTIVGSSNQFAVRPYQFQIDAENKTTAADLTAKNASDDFINTHKAGEEFNFSVRAVNTEGVITTNYQPDSGTSLALKLTRLIPQLTGVDGSFTYAKGDLGTVQTSGEWITAQLEPFKDGVSRYSKAHYDEAGAITVNVKDTDYYGMQFSVDENVSADTAGQEIGRFIPARFKLVSSNVDNFVGSERISVSTHYDYIFPESLSRYVAGTTVLQQKNNQVYECREWPNDGFCVQWSEGSNQYEPGVGTAWEEAWTLVISSDSGVTFTYMDQPELIFDYRLEAQNTLGFVTENYDKDKATVAFIADSDGIDFSSRLQNFGGTWCYGVYQPGLCDVDSTYSVGDDGLFTRLATGEDGPILDTFFGIAITDLDGVELEGKDMPTNVDTAKRLSAQASELRYGRWNINDGYGPINEPLPVAMQLEYYDGQQFIVNPDDSLTSFMAIDAEAKMKDSASGISLSGNGQFRNGESQELMISSVNPGEAILEYINTPPWLQYDWSASGKNPTAIITFGFFYGNDRVIYRRRLN